MAHRGLPTLVAQGPAQHGGTEACPAWRHRGRPTLGSPKPAHHGREACPPWAHRGRPTFGIQMPAHHGRTEACPELARRGLPTGAQKPAHIRRVASQIAIAEVQNRRNCIYINHIILHLVSTDTQLSHKGLPSVGAQRPAYCGRTEACPLWAHSIPKWTRRG